MKVKRWDGWAAVLASAERRRHHAVEERQGQRRTDAAKYRASRDGLLGDDHDSDLLI